MANTVKIGITASDEGFKSTLDNISKSAKNVGGTISAAGKEFKTVRGAVGALTKEAQMLTVQWRELDESMRNSDAGQQLYQQMQDTIARAAELKDVAGDVQNEIKNMASDTAVWDGMSQGIGVLSSGVQGLASVYGLLGGDVKAFTQALTVMNGIQAVTNTIIGIGNALQKDSALMTMLRILRTKMLTGATSASTVAIGAQTAATEAQTTAQLANNAAVLANPYVAVAAAIVGLTAAIIIWTECSDDATESQKAMQAAADAMSETMDEGTKKASDQITAYMKLKQEYDNCGGSVDQIKKKIISNTDAQKKAGIQIKNLDQATRIFSTEGTKAFIAGCNARALAQAAEAAQAALYAKVLKELNDLLNKIGTGEEVNISDIEALAKQLGIGANEMKNLARAAGYYEEHMTFTKNNMRLLDGNDAIEAQQQFVQSLFEASRDHGALSALAKMGENWSKQAAASFSSGAIDDIVTDMEKNANDMAKAAGKAGKHGASAAKQHAAAQKKTTQEIVKTLNSLEGCDAIISEAEKSIKKLNKTSSTYQQDLERLNNTIIAAKAAKLELLGDNTLKELQEAKQLIKDLINSVPPDAPILKSLETKLSDVNKKLEELYQKRASSNLPEDLEDLEGFLTNLLKTMKTSDPDYNKTVQNLKRVKTALADIKQEQEDIYNGVLQGSNVWWQRIYKRQQESVKNLEDYSVSNSEVPEDRRYKPSDMESYGINMDYFKQAMIDMLGVENAENILHDIEDENAKDIEGIWQTAIDMYKEWLEKKLAATSGTQEMYVAPKLTIDPTFSYKMSNIELLDQLIEPIQKAYDELKEKLENNKITDSSLESAQEQLKEYGQALISLKRSKVLTEIQDDISEYQTSIRDGIIGAASDVKGGMQTLYDAFTKLPETLDNAENAFEGFFAVFDSMFSIVDAVIRVIDTINTLSETFSMLNAARQSESAIQNNVISATMTQAIATEQLTGAMAGKLATDTESVVTAAAATSALKAQTAATTELAAAEFFAAHASIPFAGAGIASGFVAEMEGVIKGVGSLQMLANGGIVQGSTTIGDRVLIRANAGEMVINKTQQKRLFDMIDHGTVDNSSGTVISNVRIKGSDIILALKNYGKSHGNKQLSNLLS